MSNNKRNFEKEFITYERDIDLREDESMHIGNTKFSLMDSFLDQYQSSITPATSPAPTSEPTIQPEEPQEDIYITEVPFVMDEVKTSHEHLPLSLDEMTMMSKQLEIAIRTIIPLQEQAQRMLTPENDVRLPKGLRTTACYLKDVFYVFTATKSIIDLYVELGIEPLYQTVDECRLKTTTRCTINTFLAHAPTIQNGLDDVENAMVEGYDRPSANLRMRIIKAQAVITRSQAVQQAQALVQTIEAFPLENGSLRVLCLLEEKGDIDIMNSIDHTMEIAHHIQVPVAEAPTMMKAIINDDNKTVEAIVNRMIEQF